MTTILIGIALALTFGISNALSYKRGEREGYLTGIEDSLRADIEDYRGE